MINKLKDHLVAAVQPRSLSTPTKINFALDCGQCLERKDL